MAPYVDAFCTHTHGRKGTCRRTSTRGNVQCRKSPYVDVGHCRCKNFATCPNLLRRRHNSTTDGNATYDNSVYVNAAVEINVIDHNVAMVRSVNGVLV